MGLRLQRPSDARLADLREHARDDELTYQAVGMALGGPIPSGFTRRVWSTALPDHAFAVAATALSHWEMHRGAGLSVVDDVQPIEVDSVVAMCARLPIGFVELTCKVVTVVAKADRAGFAYGTLRNHPEIGEESFVVARDERGVRLEIVAVSRPGHLLARAVPFAANRLQEQATQRYVAAMRRICGVNSTD